MSAQHKFSSKSKPKVLKFDDVLKSVNPNEKKNSQRNTKPQGHSQSDNFVETPVIENMESQNDVQEAPLYKGISLYRHKGAASHSHNSNNRQPFLTTHQPTLAIYGGKSSEYDVWKEGTTTYVRHKVGKLFEDALVDNENMRFSDKFLNHNDPSIGTTPPPGRVKRVSQDNIKKIAPSNEYFNFKQQDDIEQTYSYNDITKKLECQNKIEIFNQKRESIIKNLTATGDVNSLSNTYIESGNILDYMQWMKLK